MAYKLSFESGRPIAELKKDKKKIYTAYIHSPYIISDKKCKSKTSFDNPKSLLNQEENEEEIEETPLLEANDRSSLLKARFLKTLNLSPSEIIDLKSAVRANEIPSHNKKLIKAYEAAQEHINERLCKDVWISPSEGSFTPIPASSYFNLYASAPSGAGKSHFCGEWLKTCKKLWPKMNIYIFSRFTEDPAYQGLKNVQYISLDESLVSDPLSVEEFEGDEKHPTCLVFDDIEHLNSADSSIENALACFQNQVLETGRKMHISTVNIIHKTLQGARTSKVINECKYVVVFPNTNFHQISSYARNYLGWDKDDIERLKSLRVDGPWALLHRDNPQYIVSPQSIIIV